MRCWPLLLLGWLVLGFPAFGPALAQVPFEDKVAALPRLGGTGPAAGIDAALDAADARVRAAVSACREMAAAIGAERPSIGWQRQVTRTMRGPRFVAFVVTDDADCGGLHPNTATFALVFDLRTGRPVDWGRLLRAARPTLSVTDAMDETAVGMVASDRLSALYRRAAMPDLLRVDASCPSRVDAATFAVWPDARRRGLVLRPFGLARAVHACGVSATISLPDLRRLRVDQVLLDAIAAGYP